MTSGPIRCEWDPGCRQPATNFYKVFTAATLEPVIVAMCLHCSEAASEFPDTDCILASSREEWVVSKVMES